MRFWILISAIGLLLSGCMTDEPSKVLACEGSTVKNCTPVIYFLPNSDEVSPYGQKKLDWCVERLKRWPEKKVLITSHANEWMKEEDNMDLAKRRALTVGHYFISKGIEPDRIRVRPLGDAEPVCQKPECQNLNRRVVVEIYNL